MTDDPGPPTSDGSFDLATLCRSLYEQSPLPEIAVEGESHIVRYLNPAFARLVGKPREELVGQPLAKAVPEGAENRFLSLLDCVFRLGTPKRLDEQEHHQERPAPAYWSYMMWPISGPDDCQAGIAVQVTDATEAVLFRKRATAMNEKLMISAVRQHELTEIAEDLNARLQAANQHKSQFMAVLSHELRTPLAPVVSAVTLLLQAPRLDDASRELLEIVDRNVVLEVRLIDDLLDMTRIERGLMEIDLRVVDASVVLQHALEVCRPELQAAGIALDCDLEDGLLLVEADPGRLQQVFWNLIRNAIKFSTAGGQVRVRCRRQADSTLLVQVEDEGIGIDPELMPLLFTPFQQGGQDQTRKYGGLGLGLSISRSIMERHGGTITAESRGKGAGATFSVTMPMLEIARSIPSAAPPTPTGPILPRRILLVEDHPDGGRATSRLLSTDGHSVEWARDVAGGLRLAFERPFDLLICDLSLPDGSGLDLMRTLRLRGSTLPGIVLSGYGQEEDIAQSIAVGFAAHLTKPASRARLREVIRLVVRDRQGT